MKPADYIIFILSIVLTIGITVSILFYILNKTTVTIWYSPDCMYCNKLLQELEQNNFDKFCKRKRIRYYLINSNHTPCPSESIPYMEIKKDTHKTSIYGYKSWENIRDALLR